jgi:hypothetical protein
MIHTLFVKEHNAIAAMLAAKYPDWGDDRLFNTARMVNAAVMAKVGGAAQGAARRRHLGLVGVPV